MLSMLSIPFLMLSMLSMLSIPLLMALQGIHGVLGVPGNSSSPFLVHTFSPSLVHCHPAVDPAAGHAWRFGCSRS
jgi:hypothetical protein